MLDWENPYTLYRNVGKSLNPIPECGEIPKPYTGMVARPYAPLNPLEVPM